MQSQRHAKFMSRHRCMHTIPIYITVVLKNGIPKDTLLGLSSMRTA